MDRSICPEECICLLCSSLDEECFPCQEDPDLCYNDTKCGFQAKSYKAQLIDPDEAE